MNLTDKPKMFLFQMCRGSEPVQAACAPPSQPAADDISYDLSRFHFNPTVPVDADILVCFASGGQLATPSHISQIRINHDLLFLFTSRTRIIRHSEQRLLVPSENTGSVRASPQGSSRRGDDDGRGDGCGGATQ